MSALDPSRPRLFVGASRGGFHVAELLREGLEDVAHVITWCEGESAPSARAVDAAAFVLCATPGHEVLLRLGVFLGVLGRERIIVCPASDAVVLPPELRDLSVAPDAPAIKQHLGWPGPGRTAEPAGHAAPRRRRSLGTATSTRSEQSLRIADISLSGALLETFGEIPENQLLELALVLEDGSRVHVAAEVVRIQHPQWGRVGGVGVRFLQFEGDSRAVLERYLADGPGALAADDAVTR